MAERDWLHLLTVVLFNAASFTSVNADEESPRILSGSKAMPGQFPAVVLVEFTKNRSKCTGTLVSTKWVLTAAHCLPSEDASDIRLVAGVVDQLRGSQSQVRQAKQVVLYPGFNGTTHHYDLALIEANETFRFSEYVRPMPAIGNPRIPKAGYWHCGTVGYGLSSVEQPNSTGSVDDLRFQRVTISDLSVCPLYNNSDTEPHLICSVIREGRGICDGNEGAPILCQGVQVGTMSGLVHTSPRMNNTVEGGGVHCGVPKDTMKIEYLGYYVDWLKSNVKDLIEPLTLKADRDNIEPRNCDQPRTPLQVATCVLLPLINMLLMVNCVLKPRWDFHMRWRITKLCIQEMYIKLN